MNEQNNRQSQQSQRLSQNATDDKPLFEIIGRCLLTPPNKKSKLIFFSKAISLMEPLAYSLIQSVLTHGLRLQELIILMDFDGEEIEWLNQCIKMTIMAHPLSNKMTQEVRKQLKVIRLNTMTIEKRKTCYVTAGVYSVSSQIFLTDLLRGEATLHPMHLSKIIIKLAQKVKSYHHYYGWLCTMLKVKQENAGNKWNVPVIFLCNQVHQYSFEEELKQIYRIFFCNKVVIWPFGRAEIHKKLNKFRQKKTIKEWQHGLAHSDLEKQIEQVLKNLFNFLKRAYGIKYGDKARLIDDLLYSRLDEQSFSSTRGEYTQFQNVKTLLSLLENTSKLSILTSIAKFIEQNTCQLWNSNNNEAITIIQTLVEKVKEGIFWYEDRKENPIKVDLKEILGFSNNILGTIQKDYQCEYSLDIGLTIKNQDNEKLNELIKILEDIKVKQPSRNTEQTKQQKQQEDPIQANSELKGMKEEDFVMSDKLLLEQWAHIQQKRHQNDAQNKVTNNILIVCNSKRAQKYVSSGLANYLSEGNYLYFLFTLQIWLRSESSKRQIILKRLYERRKRPVEGSEGVPPKPESKSIPSQRVQQAKLILDEVFLRQIQRLEEIMLDYELQLNIINTQFAKAESQGVVFDINQEEIKLNQRFQNTLAKCNFKIIDRTKIKLNMRSRRMGSIVFEGPQRNYNIVVEYFNRSAQLTHFNSLLKTLDPSFVIFYSPSTTLLRSLYLYYAEAPTCIESLHILNYQDSYETKAVQHEVVREDKAFWQISQNRSQLSQYNQTPFSRIKNLAIRDSYDQALRAFQGRSLLRSEQQTSSFNLNSVDFSQYRRIVIVDTREFKSSLPSYLYHYGFEVVPMFLKTADYVLSDQVGIEKKSVNTRDLQTSLKTMRLDEQLKRMNSSFRQAYLLIEFEEEKDVTKENFSGFTFGKSTREHSQARELRKKLFQLINRYQRVRLLWSTSVSQSCEYFKLLKMDKAEPDVLKFQKNQAQEQNLGTSQGLIPSQRLSNISQVSASKQGDHD